MEQTDVTSAKPGVVVLRIQQTTTRNDNRGPKICTFRLRLTPVEGGTSVRQEGLFQRPIPPYSGDESRELFQARYAHFTCAIPDFRVDADGNVVETSGTEELSQELAAAVRSYYTHANEFEPGLGDIVARQFVPEVLDQRAGWIWRVLFDIQTWPETGVEGATSTEISCPDSSAKCESLEFRESVMDGEMKERLERVGGRSIKSVANESRITVIARHGLPLKVVQETNVEVVTMDGLSKKMSSVEHLDVRKVDSDAQSSTALLPNANRLQPGSPSILQGAIDDAASDLGECLQSARAEGATGNVGLKVTFKKDGVPREVKVYENSVGAELRSCLTEVLMNARAEGLAEDGDVHMSLSFWVD